MLQGHQEQTTWMGEDVLTLAELWPERPRAMVIGLNPAPVSVAAGHYYQGRVGRTQMKRLAAAGLFAWPADGKFEANALSGGVGFADLVRRPTVGEDDVSAAELAHGRTHLEDRLSEAGAPLVICVFRHPVKALLGVEGAPGLQSRRTKSGSKVFRMPGPFAAANDAQRVMAILVDELAAPR